MNNGVRIMPTHCNDRALTGAKRKGSRCGEEERLSVLLADRGIDCAGFQFHFHLVCVNEGMLRWRRAAKYALGLYT